MRGIYKISGGALVDKWFALTDNKRHVDLFVDDIVLVLECKWIETPIVQSPYPLAHYRAETKVRMLYQGVIDTYHVPNVMPKELFAKIR